jgi:hypothetical protein
MQKAQMDNQTKIAIENAKITHQAVSDDVAQQNQMLMHGAEQQTDLQKHAMTQDTNLQQAAMQQPAEPTAQPEGEPNRQPVIKSKKASMSPNTSASPKARSWMGQVMVLRVAKAPSLLAA